jgi:hypothetical protein
MSTVTQYTLRKLTPADKPVVVALLVREWGSVNVAALSIGGVIDASVLPGWLAESDGEVAGLLTCLVRDNVAEPGSVWTPSRRRESSSPRFPHMVSTAFPSATRSNSPWNCHNCMS